VGVKNAADYGAEYAGFVQAFLKGWGIMVHPLGENPDSRILLEAATAAWEDHLVRVRRAESYAAREAVRQ
jgi:hypothetical protein